MEGPGYAGSDICDIRLSSCSAGNSSRGSSRGITCSRSGGTGTRSRVGCGWVCENKGKVISNVLCLIEKFYESKLYYPNFLYSWIIYEVSHQLGRSIHHMHESRYPMKTHIQSLVICIWVFIEYLHSCMPWNASKKNYTFNPAKDLAIRNEQHLSNAFVNHSLIKKFLPGYLFPLLFATSSTNLLTRANKLGLSASMLVISVLTVSTLKSVESVNMLPESITGTCTTESQ